MKASCDNCIFFGACPEEWYTTDQENYSEERDHCDQWKEGE